MEDGFLVGNVTGIKEEAEKENKSKTLQHKLPCEPADLSSLPLQGSKCQVWLEA